MKRRFWRMAALVMVFLMLPAAAMADTYFVPHVNHIRISKFELQLVGNQYWFVQKGDWDWEARPLYLQWEYSSGKTDSFALPGTTAGNAHVLCTLDKLQQLAEAENDQALKFSLVYPNGDEWVAVASDCPLLESGYNSIALAFRIWHAQGALWYAGDSASQPPARLTKTFSNGDTASSSLPALEENNAVMLLTPAQIEKDMANANIAWVEYSLEG